MPELPEVEVYRRRIRDRALRRPVETVSLDAGGVLDDVSGSTVRRLLKGGVLSDTRRHGKHVFVAAADPSDGDHPRGWLRLHFGMTGEPVIYGRGEEEPDHTRLRLDFEDGGHFAFRLPRKLGRIGVVDDPDAFVREKGLGPDPWAHFDADDLTRILEGRRGGLKATLMNQEVVAGLGNVYVDEILFQAGLHPETTVDALGPDDVERLHRNLRRVLDMTVERNADPARYPRTWLLPHRHDGAECPRCGAEIGKKTVGGRSTYHCTAHQEKVA